MNYTTYLFDFDYTLADSSRGIIICFRTVLARHGYMDVTDEQIKRTIGKTLQESFSILSGVTDAQLLEEFKKEYVKEADQQMTVNTVLFPEVKSVLEALKNSGARIGIISTKYRYRIKELLDMHFPDNFMDIMIGGEDVTEAKPSPEGLLLAIKRLNVGKEEVLYIGDSIVDAQTAQAAGVDFVGITHGVTTAAELDKYPHRKIISELDELLETRVPYFSAIGEENLMQLSHEFPVPTLQQKKFMSVWQKLILLLLAGLSVSEFMITELPIFITLFMLTLWGISQKRRILPIKVWEFIAPRWYPCKVRLRYLKMRMVNGKREPLIDKQLYLCQNCGTNYIGNYCSRCGQSHNTPRYRIGNAFRNIVGGFTNIDSGFGRTLTELLYRPGYMIRDFIGGKRIHYFRPFQTLFVLAALYIMCVQLVDPESLKQKEPVGVEQKIDSLKNDSLLIANKDNANDEEEVMVDLIESGSDLMSNWEQYIQRSPFLMKVWNLLKSWGHGNKAFRIIATLPLFALATQLAFYKRKRKRLYNLTEHVFVQAFIACQVLLLSMIVLPFNGTAKVDDLYDIS
ncbi:MAG: HAD-IA family hydrolase [Bacteroidales bacterium]